MVYYPQQFCPDCKESCEPIVVDNGIGPYEFWGARGFHSQIEVVSNCCEAPLELEPWEVRGEPDYD